MALRRSPRLQALQDRLAAAAAAAAALQPAPANIIVVQPARGQRQRQRNGNRRNGNGNPPAAVVGHLGAAQGANQPDPLQAPIAHVSEREIVAEFDFAIQNGNFVEKCLMSDRGVVGLWKARAQMLTRQIFDRNAQPATIQLAAASLRSTIEVAKNYGKGFDLFSGEYLRTIGDARRALKQLSDRYAVTSAYAAQRFLLRAQLPDLFWAPLLIKSAALDLEYQRLYLDCMRDVSSAPVAYYIAQLPRRNGRGRAQPQVQPAQPGHVNPVVVPPIQVAAANPVHVQPVAVVVPGHVPIAVAAQPPVQNAIPIPMPPQNNATISAAVAVPIVQPAAVIPTAPAPTQAVAANPNPMPQPNANVNAAVAFAVPIVPPVAVNPAAAPPSQANAGPSVSSTSSAGILSMRNSGNGPNGSLSAAGANNSVTASRVQPAIPRATSSVQGPIAPIPQGVPVGSRSAVVGVASASHTVSVSAVVTAAVQAPASRLPTPAARNILAAQSGPRAPQPQGQVRPAGNVQMRPAVQRPLVPRPLVPRPLVTRPLVPRPPALMTQSVPRLQASQGQAGPSNSINRVNPTPGTSRNGQNLARHAGYLAPTQASLNRAVARGGGPVRTHSSDVQRVRPPTLTFAPYPPVRRTLRPASPGPSNSGGAGPSGPRKRSSSADAGTKNDGEPAAKRSSSRQ